SSGESCTTASVSGECRITSDPKGREEMPGRIQLPLSIVATIALTTPSYAQQAPMSDADLIAKAMTAAPEALSRGATVVAMSNGTMRTLRKGSNDFTCMVMPDGTPMCTDPPR